MKEEVTASLLRIYVTVAWSSLEECCCEWNRLEWVLRLLAPPFVTYFLLEYELNLNLEHVLLVLLYNLRPWHPFPGFIASTASIDTVAGRMYFLSTTRDHVGMLWLFLKTDVVFNLSCICSYQYKVISWTTTSYKLPQPLLRRETHHVLYVRASLQWCKTQISRKCTML